MTDTPVVPQDIHEALFELQRERIVLKKDQSGQVGSQKTKYADLVQANEVILSRLSDLGVLWLTAPTLRTIKGQNGAEDVRFVLDWKLRHVASKTEVGGDYPLQAGDAPMKAGSAITYARRYALVAATNAVAEEDDDDGQGYGGRRGAYAQRANIPRETRSQSEAAPTARRAAQPRVPAERARPAQRPEIPAPTTPAPQQAPAGRGQRQPGPNDRFAEDGTRLMSKPMLAKLGAQTSEAGITDRGERLAIVNDMIGRETPITSANEITFEEGRGIIDAFEKALQDKDTAVATVIDIYRRTSGPVPTAEQAETGHPSAQRGARAAKKAAPAQQKTREQQIVGIPNPDGEAPPWDDEPPAEEWPEPAQPGGGR